MVGAREAEVVRDRGLPIEGNASNEAVGRGGRGRRERRRRRGRGGGRGELEKRLG